MSEEQIVPTEVARNIEKAFGEMLASRLRTLLEEKHLYQSIRVSEEQLLSIVEDSIEGVVPDKPTETAETITEDLLNAAWIASDPAGQTRLRSRAEKGLFEIVYFKIVSINTKCGACGVVSPMNLKKTTDALSGIWDRWDSTGFSTNAEQSVYTFSFQCQSCRTGMEVFVVARNRDKLTLVGRSPMETVNIPRDIPKDFRKYYSGAMVAFNSGQVLPAIFMLRTLIEQFVRSATESESESVEDEIEDYMETLPDDFKSRFPSFKDLYAKLSDVMHRADESAEVEFRDARDDIELHFDARRLFEL